MVERSGHRVQMQHWSRHLWVNWRRHKIVRNLGSRSYHHDLVLEEFSLPVVSAPNRRVEHFPKRMRLIGSRRVEANQVRTQITRDHIGTMQFRQRARTKRFMRRLTRVSWKTGKLQIGERISSRPDFLINRIGKKNNVTDPIVFHLRRWDQ